MQFETATYQVVERGCQFESRWDGRISLRGVMR